MWRLSLTRKVTLGALGPSLVGSDALLRVIVMSLVCRGENSPSVMPKELIDFGASSVFRTPRNESCQECRQACQRPQAQGHEKLSR